MFVMDKTQKECFSELLQAQGWYNVWKTMSAVKPLPLIPGLNMVTVYQMAEYFGVSVNLIRNIEKKNGVVNHPLERRWVKPEELKFLALSTAKTNYEGATHILYRFANLSIHVGTAGVTCYAPEAVIEFLPYLSGSEVCNEIVSRVIKSGNYAGTDMTRLYKELVIPFVLSEGSQIEKVSLPKNNVAKRVKHRKPSVTVAITTASV